MMATLEEPTFPGHQGSSSASSRSLRGTAAISSYSIYSSSESGSDGGTSSEDSDGGTAAPLPTLGSIFHPLQETSRMKLTLRHDTFAVPQTVAGTQHLLHLLRSRQQRCVSEQTTALKRLHETVLYLNHLRTEVAHAAQAVEEAASDIHRASDIITECGFPSEETDQECIYCKAAIMQASGPSLPTTMTSPATSV
uniref:Biogenesis of lysosome-related organelles complex 1 subunit 3 n=1 Tax=Mycena chlorophos TaxID=658473 RepID=A0ABQ0LU51_MYCCL|nr:predicted protein [Mycena chlorophos]